VLFVVFRFAPRMSTSAQAQLEAQLQKYKEAAVNLPRLVKKYKDLQAKHTELQQQCKATAADLDSSRRELSEVQITNEALKDCYDKVQSEKRALDTALLESRRELAALKQRSPGSKVREHADQPAANPDTRLLENAVREVSALRAEVCSLRSILSQRTEGAVFNELAAIRSQMSQLLSRCPKDDIFRPTTTSRACTPVHESLASPPLQSLTSLFTHSVSGDMHRASGPVATGCSQETGNKSLAQPASEASALSSQAAYVLTPSEATARPSRPPDPLHSPSSTQQCVLKNNLHPSNPSPKAAVVPSAAQRQLPPRSTCVAACTPPEPAAVPIIAPQAGGRVGAASHSLTLAPSPQPSSIKRPAPPTAVSPSRQSVPDCAAPCMRDGEKVPTLPPYASNNTVKKKRKCGADTFPQVRIHVAHLLLASNAWLPVSCMSYTTAYPSINVP
jgi:hypothetical protein